MPKITAIVLACFVALSSFSPSLAGSSPSGRSYNPGQSAASGRSGPSGCSVESGRSARSGVSVDPTARPTVTLRLITSPSLSTPPAGCPSEEDETPEEDEVTERGG